MTKQSKLWTLALGLSLIIFASACQRGEDIINPPTTEELLSDSPWLYTAHSVIPGIQQGSYVITDLYAQLDSCEQDDIYNFISTGTFSFEQGEIKCPNSDQVIDNGTWTVSEDETTLSLDFSTLEDANFEISELDRDQLILLKTYTDNGINFTETLTFDTIE